MMATAPTVDLPPDVERRIALALRMIELGAWVFPLASGTKVPLLSSRHGGRGFLDASGDPDRARTFLSNPGHPNYGVVFPEGSDIIVLDLDGGDRDRRPGWQGDWQRLYERLGPPGLTYIVRTPSGGRHAYYRWRSDLYGAMPPGDEMLGWTVRKPWKGYLVGPGSTVNGEVYEPVGLGAISDFPEPWGRAALEERTEVRATDELRLTVRGGPADVQVGHRHAYLRNQARHLVGLGLRGETLFAAVMDLNRQLTEPKTEAEVQRAIGEAESKFEPDPLGPDGRQLVSAQRNGVMGRKQSGPPVILVDLPFYSAAEVAGMTPETVDWAWRDYVAFGTVTEIVGPPKAGKTTLVFGLIRAYASGGSFLERPTSGGPVVVLTEQGPASLRAVLERTDLSDRRDVFFLLHKDIRGKRWPDVVVTAVERCRAVGSRLLVVDTLPAFAGLSGDAENNSGDALEAMQPLMNAAGDGLAVLMNRHRRKGTGSGDVTDIADEGRGSGAFSGSVDVILSLRRRGGAGRSTIRLLAAASRFDETPEELFVELVDGQYVALGDDAAIESAEARGALLLALDEQPGQTLAQLIESTGKSRQTVQRVLADLERTKEIEARGTGKRNDPRRFSRIEDRSELVSAQALTPYGGVQSEGMGQKPNSGALSSPTVRCEFFADHQTRHTRNRDGSYFCPICHPEDEK